MACILESAEIKKRWPVFNTSQKRWEDIYGIFLYEDRRGYLRLGIDKNRKRLHPVYTFHYLVDGHSMIRKLIREFQLCPKLCFLQKGEDACEGIKSGECLGACELKEPAEAYNKRVEKPVQLCRRNPVLRLLTRDWKEMINPILVCEGKFYGMGYLPENTRPESVESLKPLLTQYRENSFIRNLANGYAARFPDKVIYF